MENNNNGLVGITAPTTDQLKIIHVVTSKVMELGASVEVVLPVTEGPRLLYFGLRPSSMTKVSALEGLAGDLAVALGVEDVLVKRMPGQGVVGIFVPRRDPQTVNWLDLLSVDTTKLAVPIVLGINWQGSTFVDDLTLCPHLLVAGSTGGGKSVLMRSLVASIIQQRSSNEVKLLLSDTKGVEFNDFDGNASLFQPRATTPLRTIEYMEALCTETDYRLTLFGSSAVKNIREFNNCAVAERGRIGQLPYLVLVIDELADILEFTMKEEKRTIRPGVDKLDYITRKSRAAGIHVIAAVQRPSVDIVKGVIKNNFPSRLTFKMASQVDSRVVIDTEGAEHLLGVGDCLYKGPSVSGLMRLHTGIATTNDIKGVLQYVEFRQQYGTDDSKQLKQ